MNARRHAGIWIYLAVVLLVGFSVALSPPNGADLRIVITLTLLAVLTYPLGVLGSAACFLLIYPGIATPAEAIAVSTPLFAIAGYVQWNVIFPKLVLSSAKQVQRGQVATVASVGEATSDA
jgi:hypothetical protein